MPRELFVVVAHFFDSDHRVHLGYDFSSRSKHCERERLIARGWLAVLSTSIIPARTLPRRPRLPSCSVNPPLFSADLANNPSNRQQDLIR